MSQSERIEILVLGSGAGGKLLAWHMARSGRRTAVVERQWIGGSCPNVNCLPSKNEIWSAKVAHLVHHAAEFGLRTGPLAIDMAVVRQRKRDMVEAQIAEHGPQLMGREDPDVSEEMQRILSDDGIQVRVAAETRHVRGQSGKDVTVVVRTTSGEQKIEGSDILVAAGRTPNTAGIGLEAAG